MKTKVTKRDGSEEDYDGNKIAKVLIAAGLSPEQAQTISIKVSDWVNNTQKFKISSLEIRDRVIEEIRKVQPYVADLFVWYEKTKDHNVDKK